MGNGVARPLSGQQCCSNRNAPAARAPSTLPSPSPWPPRPQLAPRARSHIKGLAGWPLARLARALLLNPAAAAVAPGPRGTATASRPLGFAAAPSAAAADGELVERIAKQVRA